MQETYKAKLNNIRISPQKMGLVVDLVRGKNAKQAIEELKFVNKKGAKYVSKVIVSAIANAKNNFGANTSDLKIKTIFVTPGLTYKRWNPVSRGRAFRILKRGSNLTIELSIN